MRKLARVLVLGYWTMRAPDLAFEIADRIRVETFNAPTFCGVRATWRKR